MNLSACAHCVLCCSYLLLWVSSIILISIGSKAVSLSNGYGKVSEIAHIQAPGAYILAAGILLFFAAALGTTAYRCQSQNLLITCCVVLLIICFLELCAVILSFSHWATLGSNLKMVLGMELSSYGKDDHVTSDVDNVQRTLECCGINNYIDWNPTDYFQKSQAYPRSCYPHNTGAVSTSGCYPLLEEQFHSISMAIIICGIASALVQIFGLYSACVEGRLRLMPPECYRDGYQYNEM